MPFDYCVLGAGLAGLHMADRLVEQGKDVLIIDPNHVAGGASGTPVGLVNPATGRYATKSWEAESCYTSILSTLSKIQDTTDESFFKKNGVIRPALDEKIARRMKENVTQGGWPDGWCYWIEEKELKEAYPDMQCVEGGVWLPIGLSVRLPSFLQHFASYIQHKNGVIQIGMDYELGWDTDHWSISLTDGTVFTAENIITTAGIKSSTLSQWDFLPLTPVKGQISILVSEQGFPFDSSVSALGYFSAMDANQYAAGSTYEHKFDHNDPTSEGLEYIQQKLSRVLPKLNQSSVVVRQWAGVRASTPDRSPILGPHPQLPNSYIFTGLGSKGLLYSSYLADLMEAYLLEGKPLRDDISVNRFL